MADEPEIMLPRMGNWFRSAEYVIRCNCWQCHVPLWRRRHWRKLIDQQEFEALWGWGVAAGRRWRWRNWLSGR